MEGLHVAVGEELTKCGTGGELESEDDYDWIAGEHTITDFDVEDAWEGSSLGGLLKIDAGTRGDVGWLALTLDVAENDGLRVVTAVATRSSSIRESKRDTALAAHSRRLAGAAEVAVGQVGVGVGVGTNAADVLAHVGGDVGLTHDIHGELDLPDTLSTVLTEVDAEGPMILD